MDFSKYDKRKLLLLLIFSLIAVRTVAAQNFADMLENIPVLQNLTGDKIEKLYDDFWWLWDFAVYALILSTALKMGVQKALGDNAGKMGSIFAIVLSIGAVIAENQIGFNLKEFAALALAIGIFAFGLYMWRIVKGMGLGERGRLIMGILYLTIYALISPRLKGLRDAIGSMNWIISVADILAAAFAIFVVIDLINFLKGLRGGGGGTEEKQAATIEAGDAAARQEEERQHKQEGIEMTQQRREMADLSAVQALTKRELTDYDGIRRDIEKLIGILQRMQKERRANPELVEEIRQTIGHIQPAAADVRNVEQMLRTRIADLDAVEAAELRNVSTMWQSTRREITDISKGNVKGWAGAPGKGPNPKKLAGAKQKFEQDAANRAKDQLNQTRKTLEQHALGISRLEQAFGMQFNSAMTALQGNNLGQAIVSLEAAREDVKKIEAGLNVLGRNDVNQVGQDVRRKLADLQAETKLNFLGEIGVTRQARAVRAAVSTKGRLQGVAKGLRGAAQVVRVSGRNLKVRFGKSKGPL